MPHEIFQSPFGFAQDQRHTTVGGGLEGGLKDVPGRRRSQSDFVHARQYQPQSTPNPVLLQEGCKAGILDREDSCLRYGDQHSTLINISGGNDGQRLSTVCLPNAAGWSQLLHRSPRGESQAIQRPSNPFFSQPCPGKGQAELITSPVGNDIDVVIFDSSFLEPFQELGNLIGLHASHIARSRSRKRPRAIHVSVQDALLH